MAYTSGTATDYKDLLVKLRTYLIAQGWTSNRWVHNASLTTVDEFSVVGPGSGGGQPVNISIQTDYNTTANAYSWKVCGHVTFASGNAFASQPFNGPVHHFLLWPNAIDYWFYVNNRRFIVIAKIGVVYVSMYAGFFLPFALPAEYPYPFYVGATSSDLAVYSINNARFRMFCDPGFGAASYMRRNGVEWAAFNNHNDAASVADNPGAANCVVWPWRINRVTNSGNDWSDASIGFLNSQRPGASGKAPLFQAMILDYPGQCIAGLLDGVYGTTGFNRTAEQVINDGSTNYRLFINMARTRPKDFFAVEEV